MPIHMGMTLDTGVTIDFHRIDAVSFRFDDTKQLPVHADIVVGSYYSQQAAEGGKKPMLTRTIATDLAEEATRADLYSWLVADLQPQVIQVPGMVLDENGQPVPGMVEQTIMVGDETGFNGGTIV